MIAKQKDMHADMPRPRSSDDDVEVFSEDEMAALAAETTPPQQDVHTHIPVAAEEEAETPKSNRRIAIEAKKRFSDLYQRASGASSATHFERTDPNRRKKIIVWVLVGLMIIAGAAVGGFFFFVNQEQEFANEQVSASIDGATVVTSGKESTFVIAITNGEAVAVHNVEMTLQLPSTFQFRSSVPSAENDAHNAWNVGTINPGKRKLVSITGTFFGETGTELAVPTILGYRPANFNSVFQTHGSLSLTIGGSVLSLTLEAPPKSISGRADQYALTLENTSDETIEQVRLTLTVPAEMQADNFKPEATSTGSFIWSIDSLEGGETFSVTWNGTITAAQGTSSELKAEVGYTDAGGTYLSQAEQTALLFVVNPQLLITLKQNDSTSGAPAEFGDLITYAVTLENGSDAVINDIAVRVELTTNAVDWSGLVNPYKGTTEGTTIRWDASTVPTLTSLRPNEQAEISFSIPVVATYSASGADDGELTISATATARSSGVVDLDGTDLVVSTDPLVTKITTDLKLRAESRYYDDQSIPVGSGPVPPRVGATTTYRLYWYLHNSTNEVTDVVVSAVLPTGVDWTGVSGVTAGDVSYDASTRLIQWTINRIPQNAGQLIPELQAYVDVSITPQVVQVGDVVTLLGMTTAQATDTFTGVSITQTAKTLTTALTTDPVERGSGKVQPAPVLTNTNTATNGNVNGG